MFVKERKIMEKNFLSERFYLSAWNCSLCQAQKILPGRELNPGLACDRRGYSPLYYRGSVYLLLKALFHFIAECELDSPLFLSNYFTGNDSEYEEIAKR